MQMLQVVNDIKAVVESMRGSSELTDVMLPNNHVTTEQIPFFIPGHRVEINNRLLEKNKDKTNKWLKYPLIALRMDIAEEVRGDMVDYNLNIAILTSTDRNYNAEERIENVFEPILCPLYDLFFAKLRDSGLFVWPGVQDLPPHTRLLRPYWGTETPQKNEENIFTDPLDAIEILDLRISSYLKC